MAVSSLTLGRNNSDGSEHVKVGQLCHDEEVYSEYLLSTSYDPCSSNTTKTSVGYKLRENIKFFNVNCDLYKRPEKEGGHTFSLVYLNSCRKFPVEFASIHFYKIDVQEMAVDMQEIDDCEQDQFYKMDMKEVADGAQDQFRAVVILSMGWSFRLNLDQKKSFQEELLQYCIKLAQEYVREQKKKSMLQLSFRIFEPTIDGAGNQYMLMDKSEGRDFMFQCGQDGSFILIECCNPFLEESYKVAEKAGMLELSEQFSRLKISKKTDRVVKSIF